MLDEPKYWLSLIAGLIITALGGIPLIHNMGWIDFNLPFELGSILLLWGVAAAGLGLIISSFLSEDDTLMWTSIVIALVIMGITIIQILSIFQVINFSIPFLTLTMLRVLFVIEGFGLILAGIFGDK
jgi:hypothetical protein